MIQEDKLYNGKVILKFEDKTHIYSVDGKIIYGVTNIIKVLDKPAIIYWAVNQAISYIEANLQPGIALDEVQIRNLLEEARKAHTNKRNKAADIGTMIHEWIDSYIKSLIEKKNPPKRPLNKEMKAAVDGFFKWAKENKVQIIANEQKVYSMKYKYAGTLDLEAMVNGKRTMIDIKSSNAIYPEYFLQAVAYSNARKEEFGNKFPGGLLIVRLSKEDKEKEIRPFEVRKVDEKEIKIYFNAFLNCLQIYKWKMYLKHQELALKLKRNGII